MLFANSYKNEGFIMDICQDVRIINKMALKSKKTGAVVLGGGVVKHHILNANIWRNGLNYGKLIT
jgi:deoxyhypusine synthase